MRSDDASRSVLSPDERRRFDELARSLSSASGWPYRTPLGDRHRVWRSTGATGALAMIATLGVAPIAVPFLGYVVALVAGYQSSRRRRAGSRWRRIRALFHPERAEP